MALVLYKSTSSRLGLTSLTDANGDAVTNATVEATIYDRNNQQIGGTSWPISLTHSSGGNYYATLDYDLDIRIGKRYQVEVVATTGSLKKTWREDIDCEYADQD